MSTAEKTIAFAFGQLLITPGAIDACAEAGERADTFFFRHLTKDWGDLCEEDKEANEEALRIEARIFSAYQLATGVKLYCITEWDRSVTTLLCASEY